MEGDDAGDLDAAHRAVAGLFPQFARCAVLPISDQCAPLLAEELQSLEIAVVLRRQEFICGRACAHEAVRALGVDDAPIPMSPLTREPVWPDGVVGSISQTRQLAAAVAARSADTEALGLHFERSDTALNDSMRRLVLTPDENAQVAELHAVEVRLAVLIFSAKECVHKVVAPLLGYRLDFQDVTIAVDLDSRAFTASTPLPTRPGGVLATLGEPPPAVDGAPRLVLHGSFSFFDDHVATGLCLAAPKPSILDAESPR